MDLAGPLAGKLVNLLRRNADELDWVQKLDTTGMRNSEASRAEENWWGRRHNESCVAMTVLHRLVELAVK